MADAIRTLQPGYVIIENVPGIATKMGSRPGESALGTVIADLAEAGYVGSWIRLRASEVGAPHRRERVFVLATNPERVRVDASRGLRRGSSSEHAGSAQEAVPTGTQVARAEDAVANSTTAADTERERQHRSRRIYALHPTGEGNGWTEPEGSPLSPANSDSGGFASIRESEPGGIERPSGDVTDGCDREGTPTSDANRERRPEHRGTIAGEQTEPAADGDSEGREWGIYAPAILRWERLTRSAPRPTDDRGRLNPAFTEWMMGFPDGWTEGESRTQRLKMLGNAVVVQVGEAIGRMLYE